MAREIKRTVLKTRLFKPHNTSISRAFGGVYDYVTLPSGRTQVINKLSRRDKRQYKPAVSEIQNIVNRPLSEQELTASGYCKLTRKKRREYKKRLARARRHLDYGLISYYTELLERDNSTRKAIQDNINKT